MKIVSFFKHGKSYCLVFMAALAVLLPDDNDKGQSFLKERLPDWQRVINAKDEIGCFLYRQEINGKVVVSGVRYGDGKFLYKETKQEEYPDLLEINFSNPDCSADVRSKNGVSSLSFLGEPPPNGFWDYPFMISSNFQGRTYTDMIENDELVLKEYSNIDGIHSCLFSFNERDETIQFFFDDAHALPIKSKRTLKGGGSELVKFEKFQIVSDDFNLPSVVHIELSGANNQTTSGKFDLEFDSQPFDTKKCHLEYYGLANPDRKFAEKDKPEKWKYALFFATGVGLLGVGFLIIRKGRK